MACTIGDVFVGECGMEVARTERDDLCSFFDGMFFLSRSDVLRLVEWLSWHYGS